MELQFSPSHLRHSTPSMAISSDRPYVQYFLRLVALWWCRVLYGCISFAAVTHPEANNTHHWRLFARSSQLVTVWEIMLHLPRLFFSPA